MNRAKNFERLVRRMALTRLKASPRQWESFQRSRPNWSQRLTTRLMTFIGYWTAAVMLIGLPLRAGVGIGNGGREVAFAGTVAVLIGSSMALGHARWLLQELVASRALAVMSQLPVADTDFLDHRVRRMLLMSLTSLAATLAYFFGIAVGARLPLGKSLVTAGLGVIEWLIVVSIAVIIPAYFPRLQRPRMVRMLWGVTLISLIGGVVAGVRNLLPIDTVLSWLLGLIPTGWPLLMVAYGVMGQSQTVWYFLVGVGVLLVLGLLALQRMRLKYQLAEINFSEHSLATAVLQPQLADPLRLPTFDSEEPQELPRSASLGLANDHSGDPAPREITPPRRRAFSWFKRGEERPQSILIERDVESCRALIRSRGFLSDAPWPRHGWFESSFLNIVDDREKLVAEIALGSQTHWSPSVFKTLQPISMLVIVAIVNGRARRAATLVGVIVSVAWIISAMMRSWPAIIWKAKTGQQLSIVGLLPISTREIMGISIKLGIVRAGYFAPFLFGLTAIAIFGARGEWNLMRALVISAKSVLIVVALHQWAMISTLPTTSSRHWKQQLGYAAVMLTCLLGAIGGGIGLLAAGRSELNSLIAALILLGCGWIAQRFEQRTINRGPIDFVTVSDSADAFKNRREQDIPELTWS